MLAAHSHGTFQRHRRQRWQHGLRGWQQESDGVVAAAAALGVDVLGWSCRQTVAPIPQLAQTSSCSSSAAAGPHGPASVPSRRSVGAARVTAAAGGPSPPPPSARSDSVDPAELDELLYTPGEEVPYYMGPLELREVPGAGVGVYLKDDVPCGTLLLACYPLALLRARPTGQLPQGQVAGGTSPTSVDLAEALTEAEMSPLAAAWLLSLYDGNDSGGGGRAAGRRLGHLKQLFRQPFDPSAASPGEGEGGSGAAAVRRPLPPDAVKRVVSYNAYGEPRPDAAVAALRMLDAEQQGPCVGLWPPFSLINHSCAPASSYGLVGDVMVVRAAVDMRAGQQVTISYFGRRALAPLELRRAYLAQHYGFICTCKRCRLEQQEGGEEEEGEEGQARGGGEEQDGSDAGGAGGGVQRRGGPSRLPHELPAFLEGLHTTCSRVAAPHLMDLLSGRRWVAAPSPSLPPDPLLGEAVGTAGTAAETPGTATGPVPMDEAVSEVVEELTQLHGYLSSCWQQLLRAAAMDGGADGGGGEAGGAADGEGGQGLSQQELLWLEGSVFVLLDQLVAVVGALGLLQRIQEERGGAVQAAAGVAAEVSVSEGMTEGATARSTRKAPAGRRKPTSGDGGDGGGGRGELTAAAAMRSLAARRWQVEELPRRFLLSYVDLLAQALDVASAVAPGSDLAVACAVRLLYGVKASLGPDADEYRQAEINCYDALSARFGVLEYDTYEQVLDVCSKWYGAEDVRLPGVAPPVVATAGGAVGAVAAARSTVVGGGVHDAGAPEGGMVGLRTQAVAVEAEVVSQ